MSRRVGLVGCVKEKSAQPRRARELYLSTLFRGRRAYVEQSCDEWWILSAKHGLVHPDEMLDPYDVTLKNQASVKRRAWSRSVLEAIDTRVRPTRNDVFEIHAGAEYREFGLIEGLAERGCDVLVPTQGLGIGKQLQFYQRTQHEQG
jgi:hypothetical protein